MLVTAVVMLQVLSGARGRAVQMNLGAGQAHGTFLIFLHADSQLPEGYVAQPPYILRLSFWARQWICALNSSSAQHIMAKASHSECKLNMELAHAGSRQLCSRQWRHKSVARDGLHTGAASRASGWM